ncbi:MAG: HAD family hydrolase [Anaerolineaceae bacterium]|jgi:putative hydrolase of the HAD superfamily|nr:HAD family hydrolase [Anaerolineaceae bacterium]
MFEIIAFDADDTLWKNEDNYLDVLHKLQHILSRFASPADVETILNEAEHRNVPYYGYGIKSYILSCLETAVIATKDQLTSKETRKILDLGKYMVDVEVELLDHVQEAIETLSSKYALMLLTKGDLLDQERKLARSGLAPHFQYIEIVSGKQPENYAAILKRYQIEPSRFLMIGNSLRSDILPVIAIGGQAVHIPHASTWVHERVDPSEAAHHDYHELASIQMLPAWLEEYKHHRH